MEGYVRHSRSHSRAPPHPSSSGTGPALYKKSYTNGGAGTGFTDYDDVFGGPPKFGVTPFTPRPEDYSEIFGSFLSSRVSSIPMLGLPPVDDTVAAFDVAGCSGSEYSDVFGGFESADFAVHYDELFERSHSGDQSSDDAWTRIGTESLSEESDPSACSERNPYFLHGEFHQSLDCNQLNVSYNKVNLGPIEDSNITYIAQLSAVPGYTYIVNGSSSLQKEDAERYSSGVADDIILCEDPSGNISVKPLWKASSVLPHGYVGEQLHDYDKNAGLAPRTDNYYVNPTFVSDSEISPRAEPSHLPSPSIPPSLYVDSKEDSVSSASDYEVPKSRAAETTVDSGPLHFFDLELDAGSSAVASAAAMKEAMDKAKVKLKNAKELMERKKDGLKGLKPGAKNEINGEGKARPDSIESSLSNDQKQKACKREQDQFMNYGKDVQDASRTSAVSFDPMRVEHVVDGASTHANGGFINNQSFSLDHGSVDRDGELKEATQYCELLNNCNTKVEPTLTHTAIKLANDKNASHFGIANGKTESAKHQEEKMEGMYVLAPENEDSRSDEEPYDPMENRRRLRTTKASSRKEFHRKMLKVAQEVHETVIGDHVETEMRLNDGDRGNEIERNLDALPEGKLNERRFEQADQHVDSEEKHKWESDTSGIEFRPREDFAQGEYGKTETDTCMFEGKERRTKEFYVGEETLNERRFEQADQHVDSEEKHKWESDTSGIEFRPREDFAQGEYGKTETDTCMSEGKERRTKEFYVGEETLEGVKEVQGREENGNGVNKAHEFKESKDAFSWKEKEVRKRVVCTIDEDICLVNEALAQKEQKGLSGSTAGQDNDGGHSYYAESLKIPDDVWERVRNEMKLQEVHRTEQGENNIEAATISHLYEMKMEDSFELEENEKHELSTEDSESGGRFDAFQDEDIEKQKLMQQNKSEEAEKIYNGAPEKDLQRFKDYVQAELNSNEQNNFPGRLLNVSEFFSSSNGPSSLDDKKIGVPEVLCQCDDLTSFDAVSSHDDKDTRPNAMACEGEKKYIAHATEDVAVDEEKGDLGRDNFIGKTDSKMSKMADLCTSDEHLQKTEAAQTKIAERKESIQKRSESSNISQGVVKEGKAINGYLAPEEREKAETSRRDDGPKNQHLRTFDEEKEKERERKIEERVRKLEELREEQERKLEMERLRKLEEERERDRVKELEEERLRKLEEEWEREREREKDRMGLDFQACERAERVTAERTTVEAQHRAMAEARERLEKACAEAREKSLPEKTSVEARLRAERAAVERATAEARERALEKAKAERVTSDARVERSSSEKISTSFRDIGIRHCLSSSDLWDVDKFDGLEGESAQRCKARLERHRRTVERVAKALAEKNMRDLIAQREQAERNRLAESLDVEIKRWSSGKEGNLRALLSTLQYILDQDSGWQPIPLTEVITSVAVKKAYRKATLYVHPDKLQQRGATIQQKYTCEKVFDLLKDAWNRFNSEER